MSRLKDLLGSLQVRFRFVLRVKYLILQWLIGSFDPFSIFSPIPARLTAVSCPVRTFFWSFFAMVFALGPEATPEENSEW